ncbi:MAG TPA: hypothetical protein VG603_10495, partial [Chitinophagales bacterium]|nr:hypothetical protein [Chitinophagales bacterium]
MKKTFTLFFAIAFAFATQAQTTVTWAQDIAPILYQSCTKCHHNGGLAPFALLTYNDAYNQRTLMKYDVMNHIMPPWPPDPTYCRYAQERIISAVDINKIRDWVDAGAPMGDTTQAPAVPTYTNASELGAPDISVRIPDFTVPSAQNNDIYQCFVLPSGLTADEYITAMEIIPGNPEIVHHVLIFEDTTGTCHRLDSLSPGPGYLSFGSPGTNNAILIGGWVPGATPTFMPANMGIKLYKHSDIVIQVHYPVGSNNKLDSTRLNLKIVPSVPRPVLFDPVLAYFTNMVNGPLKVPADSVKTFVEHFHTPAYDATAISVAPHCHLLGQNWLCFAVTPQGDTIPLIKINKWDFHWQGFYEYRNLLKIPANSDLYAICQYDNTSNNPENPNNPPQQVTAGEATSDEMMLVFFGYTLYLPGDENVVTDTSALVDITDTVTTPVDTTITDTTTAITQPHQNDIVSTVQLY